MRYKLIVNEEFVKMKKAIKEIIKWIVRGAIYIWFKIFYGAEIKGLENIPKEGALIFC